MTEKRLLQAFDYQRIEGNARLKAVIDAAHRRTSARELTEDELDLVAAAGTPETVIKNKRNLK